ncbi:MAG: hypothetical protein GVY13_07670 [Alphaproteobacteria bacterium]|jgi:uncharacterized heparinase superfamily protein|nr:hypothetical protein [Alphaproteobacteria bacterium]
MGDRAFAVPTLGARLRRALFASGLYGWTLRTPRIRALRLVPPDPWPGDAGHGAEIVAGRFGGVVEPRGPEAPVFGDPALGADAQADLGGFAWLRDLRAAGGDDARRTARQRVDEWLETCDRWHPVYWRPDVLGRRIANWIALHDFFCLSADDGFREDVFASLSRQTRHLSRTLADARPGPELIAAVKGLVVGALALPGHEDRLSAGLARLRRDLPEQLSGDGGAFGRNPAMLLLVLRDLADLRAALNMAQSAIGVEDEAVSPAMDLLRDGIDRLVPGLRLLRHGDGRLALFNGSQEGDPALIEAVLSQTGAGGKPLKSAGRLGYQRVLAGRTLLLMDVGAPPPLGHDRDGHAGPLSLEMSDGRERLVVNCGAWPYPDGAEADGTGSWHAALRGTAAHSTVTVGETNALPIRPEGGFAGRPGRVTISRVAEADGVHIEASHDFYGRLFGLRHERSLWISQDGGEIRGEDLLIPTGRPDGETVGFAARFHLHPDVTATPDAQGTAVGLRLASGGGWVFRSESGPVAVAESVYVGSGTQHRRTAQLVLSGASDRQETARLTWSLKRGFLGSALGLGPEAGSEG